MILLKYMLFTIFAVQCALVEKIGVASVILLPTKTVIPLADISSLHGTILCFKALTLTLLNLTLGSSLQWFRIKSSKAALSVTTNPRLSLC